MTAQGRPAGSVVLADVAERIGQVRAAVGLVAAAATALLGGTRAPCRDDIAALRWLAAAVLRDHAGLAAGAGVVLAPGELRDVPRSIDWWWAADSGAVEQLQVDLDPESAGFSDYTTTEWYRTPEATGEWSIAGPYVDYICTHQYTFTLSVPVRRDGKFAGVAGADILAGQVERLVLPALTGLGHAAVVASANGRVIASNTGDIVPGTVVPARHGTAEPAPGLPWTIFHLGGEEP